MPGESRSELLRWLNEVLDLKLDKVERCGTGAVFCQLLDYVYRDVPMHKVKFNTTNEYEYRSNWKILQLLFSKHNITKVIDVERLIKCRLQDNLELLQWFKKYCDDRAPVEPYDAATRRSLAPPPPGSGRPLVTPRPPLALGRRVLSGATPQRRPLSQQLLRHATPPLGANGAATGAGAGASGARAVASRELAETQLALDRAQLECSQLRKLCDSLETERNFYFNKLRLIEILTQNILDAPADVANQVDTITVPEMMKQVQSILYLVDDGFQLNEVDDESF